MRLITQPEAGIAPILSAVRGAKRIIDIVIFRFDLDKVEEAIEKAVERGVNVRALIAHTNRGGERRLRRLEQRLLEAGVTVSRTNDDLVRYHGKLLIIDNRVYILGFNYTEDDVQSRSFGLVIKTRRIVREARRLFDADANRLDYTPRAGDLVISPENARPRLERFIRKARVSLDIYDPQLTDDAMIALLARQADRGVVIRVIGKLEKKWQRTGLDVRELAGRRLHVRAIVRDGRRAFLGSQSLRKLELDERREVGIIIRENAVVQKIQKTFERDWRK